MSRENLLTNQHFNAFDVVCFLAFCVSVPLLLPVLDLWQTITVPAAVAQGSFLPSVPFSTALSLAAMFTALAYLFVCLLKTGHTHISRRFMILALVCYALGYGLLNLWSLGVVVGPLAGVSCGFTLGFGSAVMSMAWVTHLRAVEFKRALMLVWAAATCVFGIAVILAFLGPVVTRVTLDAAAVLALVGGARVFFRTPSTDEYAVPGANWWDVFGHLDVSVVEGTDDFKAPLARALFFAIMPLAMLLLFVADDNLARSIEWGPTPQAIAGVLAMLVMVPLARFKTDQALINFSYRFFLPLVAFAVLAATVFVDPSLQHLVMGVGSLAFCTIYALVMSAMLVSMAGRMRSLALPAAGIMIIAGCLVCLLSNAHAEPGVLGAYQYQVVIVLFVGLAVMLMITPSSRLWRVMLEGIDAVESGTSDAQEAYVQRCTELSETYHLTAREAEILQILGRGHSASFVADALTVAESTVRSHRKNIYRKMGVTSREELFKLLDAPVGTQETERSEGDC